jgi:Family of unknown function (DUF5329)
MTNENANNSGTRRIVLSVLTMRFLLSLISCVLATAGVHADVTPASEAQRIEYLIHSVEELSNAKFIRNGYAYDAQAAADHLRLKLRAAGARCNTADDFIRVCGSRSSVSGQPYQIRFADGTLSTSEAFLRAKLKELDTLKQ